MSIPHDQYGEVFVRKNSENGAVTIVQADDRIGIAASFLAQPLDPTAVTIAWPRITFCGAVTYRIVDFHWDSRVFVAEKEAAPEVVASGGSTVEHHDPSPTR